MLNNENAFGKPYTKSTINNYITRVCLFYKWAFKRNILKNYLLKKMIKVGKNIKYQYLMGYLIIKIQHIEMN